MGRSLKKGPVRRHAPAREDRGDEPRGREESHQDLVAALDRDPRDGRAHARRAQREEVHPGLRDREHGRPQARRVRADAALQGPHDQGGRESRDGRRRRRARRRARAAAGAGGGAKPAGAGSSHHDSGAGHSAVRAHVGAEGGARARSDPRQGRQPRARDAQVHAQGDCRGHREGAAVGDCERAEQGRVQRRRRSAVRVGVLREPGAVGRSGCGRRRWAARSAC